MHQVMDGDEKASCDYCKTRSKCIKRLRIHRFPPILVLHIKRFRYNEYTREKLTTTIRFPLTGLDLEKYGTANFECKSVVEQCLPSHPKLKLGLILLFLL